MTVKNYNVGLSKVIHESTPGKVFHITGPMGKGLGIMHSGVHIAFTAGTGVLVFVDLVAYMIRKNLGLLSSEDSVRLNTDFKFVLYVSFPNRSDSVALELIDGLAEITKKFGFNNFELLKRFSNESKERWNEEFIERQLNIYHK